MKTKISLFMLISLLLLVAAGCGSSEEATKGSSEAIETDENIFVFGRSGDAVSLDPAQVTDSVSENVSQNVLETLVKFGEGTTTEEPSLAKDWEFSEDGLTYTFYLHEGITFHDGTDFNAEAVVYNFDRWMNASEEEQAKFAQYATVFGGFNGDENHVIADVVAVDEYTVEFTLKNTQPTFLKNLALTPFSISSPAAIEEHGDEYGNNPVGTGPFVFDEWRRNDRIVLTKNENYWVDGFPKVEQVIFRTIPDSSARVNALYSGEIDMMDGLDPSNVDQIEEDENLQVLTRPSLNTGYLAFTVTREPFDNKLVRQALNHAVDKQGIIDAFFGGQAEPAKNVIPASIPGYNDEIDPYPYDLEKAKALLEEAGYSDGFEMELWAMPVSRPYMPAADKVAEILQNSFGQIGVDVTIQTYEWATYLEKVVAGEADAFLLGWTGTNGDADDFIYTLFHEESIGSLNSTRFVDDELNELLSTARTTPNQDERIEMYKRAQEILHEEAPMIPMAHATPALAANAKITGFDPHPTGRVDLTKISFE